ncbi:MAG: hypothetical protein ACQEUN_17095 [Pseudomonadota bacterium]
MLGYDVLVHFGAPKTGTTAIQKFCLDNRKPLLEHGIYYPEHPLDSNNISAGHTWFAKRILDGDESGARKLLDEHVVLARKKDCVLLISSEALYGRAEAAKRCLQGYKVGVVGWFREPLSFFVSNYMQGIKRHGQKQKMEDYCLNFLEGSHPYLDGQFLHTWADQFGDRNCKINTYHRGEFAQTPLEYQFLSAIGVARSAWPEFSREEGFVNRGYVDSALELKRLLNHVINNPQSAHDKEADVLLQAFSDRSDEPHWELEDKLDARLFVELSKKFSESNKLLSARFPGLQLAEAPKADHGVSGRELADPVDIVAPLKYIKRASPSLYEFIFYRTHEKIVAGGSGYPLLKVADLLGISFSETMSKRHPLNDKTREALSRDNVKVPDCLREFGVHLERTGAYEDALTVMELALAWRPAGEGIKRIKSRIEKKIKLSVSQEASTGKTSEIDSL